MAMSNAERQRRYRAKRKSEGKTPKWVDNSKKFFRAGDIARQRLEDLLSEKLQGSFDVTEWEFYTFLYAKAKDHKLDHSGYASLPYQADEKIAQNMNKTK